ncbi:hypothetical protein ACJJIQ_00155 (plasmid) [Microbulbifer sp. ANSA003]|uniref:hypothetical protein n=1 Tax=Microbulbifer sp. ANSA003 TaxID=3243360 RepID=UPI004042894C
MQFTIRINQARALEWGLNVQQAVLFDFLYGCPSWADLTEVDGKIYTFVSRTKIIEELPLLTDKPDTAYRLLCQLQKLGLIHYIKHNGQDLVAVTDLGKTWNRTDDAKGTEKNSSAGNDSEKSGKKSEQTRKKIRKTSEKNPTYQNTNNQPTKDQSKTRTTEAERLDYSSWPEMPSRQVFDDWVAVRKDKKLKLTQTAVNRIGLELHKAAQHGYSVDDCLAQGWGGFKLEWLLNQENTAQQLPAFSRGNQPGPLPNGNRRTRDMSISEMLNAQW